VPNPEQLGSFVEWYQRCITGDEKGQAQIFLDRLFQGFGLNGSLDVGGSPEFRVLKSAEDGGGTSFADYVWKPIVLIEMKKRGENHCMCVSPECFLQKARNVSSTALVRGTS
jgi:hypothetical protein